jgi:fructose-1,6-bisphosphatase/inositol monophosphatase family enzyme
MPHWCISIGLERRLADGSSEVHAGVIYAPAADEMFWAEKGSGAFMNERRLRVSARREMHDAVFATGIPFGAVSAPRQRAFSRTLTTLMPQVAGIRRFGAAALDLAWVAHGRFDGYWELGIKPWDICAGLLLVREAGGYATDVGDGDRGTPVRLSPATRCCMRSYGPSWPKVWCLRRHNVSSITGRSVIVMTGRAITRGHAWSISPGRSMR